MDFRLSGGLEKKGHVIYSYCNTFRNKEPQLNRLLEVIATGSYGLDGY